jgi:hypothetical protein
MNFTTLHFIRRSFASAWLFVLTVLSAVPVGAATGDLVVVCYNSDGNDDFALIALANLPGGSRFFISDNGWSTNLNTLVQEGGSPSPNGQIQFDVAAGGIPFGTVIKFDQSGANVVLTDPSLATLTMVARFPVSPAVSGKLSFSAVGDQVMVYQTAGNTVGGAVTMVSAFSASTYQNLSPAAPDVVMTQVNGWQVGPVPQNSQTAATSECNAPGGLVVYNGSNGSTATAFGLGSFLVGGVTNQDNYKYNGSYSFANKTAALTAINNPANWVANDVTPFDLTTVGPGPGAAEINLLGNGANITDGSTTPLAADFTLFGSAPVTGGTIARTFTIQNLGTANLTIPAAGITFSGANAGEFSVSGISLPATIAPAGSTTFVVTFDPSAAGVRNATINIANNDSNENPYDFALSGIGFNYTAPGSSPPPFKWSSTIQTNNIGTTRSVGSTTSGDVIAGSKINTGSPGNIRVTRHAAATGALIWTRDIDSGNADDINDMVVDPATGDAYIAARASVGAKLNWFVHKVNGNGTLGWTYTFSGGTAAGADECFAIARTSDGNVVAVGMTTTAASSFARAAKINASTGAEMNSYTSPTALSQFNGVATDGSGNTYITGFINAANANGLTMKFNSTLGVIWTQTFDGAAALFDSFSSVVVLPVSGDCVVGGSTRINSTNSDAIVIRYAAASPGTEVWRRVISGTALGSEALYDLAVDASGDLYAAGAIRNFTTTDREAYVSKITGSSGALAWTTSRLGSAADSSDRFQNVRVSGSAVYAVGNLDNATRDILASRFNAGTGVEEWTFTFNGSGNNADDVFSRSVMTLLGTDALAIGGETVDVSANTYGIVLKYSPNQPPTVSNVAKTVNEDTVLTFAAADFTGSYSDPDANALAIVRVTSLPVNGLLKISGLTFTTPLDIAIASIGNLTYTPTANYNGGDNFGWNASDGALFAASSAQVNLTIPEVNDPPVGVNDVLSNVSANSSTRTNSFASLLANDSPGAANESGQTLTIISVGSAVGGAVSIAGTNVLFTPTLNYAGPASYLYTLQDNGTTAGTNDLKTGTATVTFNILGVPPTITCPANLTPVAAGYCPPPIAFAATVTAGVPAPVVSYKLGASLITSPYAFPVGTNVVTSIATNTAGTNTCSFNVIVAPGAAPQLLIQRTGTNVVVSWTNAYPCYTFQFASGLASNSWSNYPGPFATNNGKIFVTNSATLTNRYFRLSY